MLQSYQQIEVKNLSFTTARKSGVMSFRSPICLFEYLRRSERFEFCVKRGLQCNFRVDFRDYFYIKIPGKWHSNNCFFVKDQMKTNFNNILVRWALILSASMHGFSETQRFFGSRSVHTFHPNNQLSDLLHASLTKGLFIHLFQIKQMYYQ